MSSDPERTRPPTVRDVAAVAECSVSTVSRVINKGRVNSELAARVLDAIEGLGYRLNPDAQTLGRRSKRRITIKDVAREAGLSRGTVSLWLRNKPISPDSLERIEKATQQLGYEPHTYAQNLRRSVPPKRFPLRKN